ncbi:GyrI-like domain-containing protein [Methylobacterium nigriterrae]|uniref:GyrI-like domain-containing protein n=1 Tax=Methylobacterium nigriterrae TaxID=3127512 RepID=UPI0030134902
MIATSASMSPVRIVDVAPRLAAVVRRRVRYAEMGDAQRRARPLLEAALGAADVVPDGPPLTVWRPVDGGLVDYAPGLFVPRPIAATGEVSLLTLPAGQAAHLKLTGSYAGLPAAWERLFAGCEGRARTGLQWEVYTAAGANPEATETDLFALLV